MLLRSFKNCSRTLPNKSFFGHPATYSFCNAWKPHVPKYEMKLDKSTYRLAHPIWDLKSCEQPIDTPHHKPQGLRDWFALTLIRILRSGFDFFSGYKPGKCDAKEYLTRIIFLETVAGVPGMIGAMVRHTRSVGLFQPDGGWIHYLLEEAENERMHLFTFLDMRNPGYIFKAMILGGQAVFVVAFTIFYVITPKTAHRFVGYLEEEAVKTYSHCIDELKQNKGTLSEWNTLKAPQSAIDYWNMPADSTIRDVILMVRADEMMHREVNHRFADLRGDQPMDPMEIVVSESKK